MNICIFGGRGWIGSQLVTLFKEKGFQVIIPPNDLRADDEIAVRKYLETEKPDRVVCCIGRTHGPGCGTIDYIEDKLVLNIRDNLYAPMTLAMTCKDQGIHFCYFGTGCIFEYDHEHGKLKFTEEDTPNFFGSGYSIVKGYTDRLMRQLEKDVLQIRIRMPITGDRHSRNFITKITSYEKVCSVPNSMTVLPCLLPLVVDMVEKELTGTINLTNPGCISHNEILELYKEIVDPSFTWKNFTIEEQNQILKAKRSNNELDTTLLEMMYPKVDNIKDAVIKCLEQMKSVQ